MKIELTRFKCNNYNFSITIEDNCFMTSGSISKLLNLDIITYNNALIKYVIQHNKYESNLFLDYFVPNTSNKNDKDITFHLNDVSEEVYLERFKNTFNKELTLLSLGGV